MFSHDDATQIQQPVIRQTITILWKNRMKNFYRILDFINYDICSAKVLM
jgi:hypothetical protein